MARRFDLTETLLMAGVCTTIGVSATMGYLGQFSPLAPMTNLAREIVALELAPLAERFGPDHDSQFAEEWIVRDFFQDTRDGIFLDVGANHYRNHSVTYGLETRFGWSGLAIDAQDHYGQDYLTYRPKTQFIAAFVSDRDGAMQTLHVPRSRPLNASGEKTTDPHETTHPVQTATLNRLLRQAMIERVDLMNLDIEGFELQALAGFDIQKYRPALVCVEAHRQNRQALLDYFHAHGYVVVGAYLRVDPLNLYFRPATRTD